MTDQDGNKAPTLLQSMASVLAAFFGVQNNKTRERDFTHGKFSNFIILGIIGTIVFILLVYGLVSLVMSVATP